MDDWDKFLDFVGNLWGVVGLILVLTSPIWVAALKVSADTNPQ